MIIANTIQQLKAARRSMLEPVGFVPTMGAIHEGHLALVKRSLAENDYTIVSIFVNPTQFGYNEDFDSYPRSLEQDCLLLEREGVDAVFAPDAGEIYPPYFNTWVDVKEITSGLEGRSRPGHFKGVATVVLKLFNIVAPQNAYFGQKDIQQAYAMRQMVRDLNLDIDIKIIETVREFDNLAVSSRNVYLSRQEREAATIFIKALTSARDLRRQGETNPRVLVKAIKEIVATEPLARLDYVRIGSPKTLKPRQSLSRPYPALALIAGWIGNTRLIDNIFI
jgi:pantoate--beta-alanine ligase